MRCHTIPAFVRLIFPLGAGILCFSACTALYLHYILAALGLLIITCLLWINLHYKHFATEKYRITIIITLNLLPFIVGAVISLLNNHLLNESHFSRYKPDYLLVEIIDEPIVREGRMNIRVAVQQGITEQKSDILSGNLLLTISLDSNIATQDTSMNLQYGDQLIIPAVYNDIAGPRNPYEFNVRQWYARQNYYQQAYLPASQVLLYSRSAGNQLVAWSLILRKKQVERFRKLLSDDEANAVAATLILGYRADLTEDTLMSYSKTGTIHALSVSGMHVGLIYLIIQFLLGFLDRWSAGKILKLVIAITLIWLYTLVSGLAPSVLRSAIMLSIYISAKTFSRDLNSYNLLCFAAFFMLLHNPNLIYDVGFQLSYLSVFGLILLQPLIYNWIHFDNFMLDKLWRFFALSSAAQLVTFPFALYYFHQFPLYFLISNLFITLPVALIMYIGLAILLLRVEVLGPVFEWLIRFNNAGLKWISQLPFAAIEGVWVTQLELILLCLALACSCYALVRYHKVVAIIGLFAFLLLAFSFNYRKIENVKQQRVIIFSLRRNFAMAALYHDQAWIFTDLKSTDKSFRNFVKPALDQSGIKQVIFLNSHSHKQSGVLSFDEHQLHFLNLKVLLVDSCFNNCSPSKTLSVDLITLGQHTKTDLKLLLGKIKTRNLIADGSNSVYRINQYTTVAQNYGLSLYNLRIKEAYLINVK